MTNIEAAEAAIGQNYPFDESTYRVGLASAGLDPNAEMTPGKSFDLALAALILYLITAASRISEGGYTVELDMDALLRARSLLLQKWDRPDYSGPVLRNKTWQW